jgi:glycosyltransferase involved in cell wall biosynthesis
MEIAIVIVTYNRPKSLVRLLSSINNANYCNSHVSLIISIDYQDSESHEKVVQVANEFDWKFGEKQIIEYQQNMGLRAHILKCGELLNKFDAVIVLEDDVTVSPSFYLYAKATVEKYYENDDIAGISLYNFAINYQNRYPFTPINNSYDVYFMNCAQSWGQIWMKKQWKSFEEWYKLNNESFKELPHLPAAICSWPESSWLKYHTKYCIEQNKYFVYPYNSFTTNYGDVGTHAKELDRTFQVPIVLGEKIQYLFPNNIDDAICYDGFFENKAIPSFLKIKKNEICVDLNGMKKNREYKRYWLSANSNLPYRKIQTFDLSLRPIDANIVFLKEGNGIFLYDTSLSSSCKNKSNSLNFFLYKYNLPSVFYVLRHFDVIQVFIVFNNIMMKKVRKIFQYAKANR